jgi:hypothetical protein
MIDTLVAAVVTSLFVGLAYVLLFPREPAGEFESIEGRVIEETIEASTRTTRAWDVRARTANYFSRATLPWLTKSALQTGRSVQVRMQVLDPENERLLAAYARFRSNHPGEAARWTTTRVKHEIYASLLQAALWRCEAPRLEVRVGLSPAFWVMSLDITDTFALVSGQNRGDPALVFRGDSTFFGGWRDDFDASFGECRIVTPEICDVRWDDLESPTAECFDRIRDCFVGMGIPALADDLIRTILGELGGAHHYA